MQRSFINRKIREAIAFCESHDFHLPRWAYWPASEWASVGEEADDVRRCGLGWDVTDFGSNDYANVGLLAFTIRNGSIVDVKRTPGAKDYCEKLLLVDEGQVTPTHFHWAKMEDIINRAGGRLTIQLWLADPETETLDEEHELSVSIDGIQRVVAPGGTVVLEPGESITLCPYVYHNFHAEKGRGMVLGGEVSRVNDDANDNRFPRSLPRFSAIEEDEPPAYLLCAEYPKAAP
jgi:D-lyxose ketol-isomerase